MKQRLNEKGKQIHDFLTGAEHQSQREKRRNEQMKQILNFRRLNTLLPLPITQTSINQLIKCQR